jgi:hypothetical protein
MFRWFSVMIAICNMLLIAYPGSATTVPGDAAIPLPARVRMCDLLLLIRVRSDNFVQPDANTMVGSYRQLEGLVKATIKGDIREDDVGVTREGTPPGERYIVTLKYHHWVKDPIIGITAVINKGNRPLVVGRRYFLMVDRVQGRLELVGDAQFNYVVADTTGVDQMVAALEGMRADGPRVQILMERLETLTPEEYQELVKKVGVNFGEPAQHHSLWQQWWKATGKNKFTLSPTWRETLEKLRQEVARQEPATPAADPPPAPAPEKPPE